jgi:hypothetical protein
MAQQQNPQNQQNRNSGQQNQQNSGQQQQWDQQRDDDITSQAGVHSGGITGSKGMNAGQSSDDAVEGRDFDREKSDRDDELDNEDVQFGSNVDDDDDDFDSESSEDALSASNRNAGKRTDKPIGSEANSDNDGMSSELGSQSQGTRAAGTKKGMNQQQSDQGSSLKH